MFQIELIHGPTPTTTSSQRDRSRGRLDRRDRRGAVAGPESRHRDAGDDLHAQRRGLSREAAHRRHVVRVAAALFVQHRRDVLRLPVVEEPLHVAHRLGFALDEYRLVADRLLLLVDRADLRVHHLGADLHVADGVVAVGLGIALPDRYRMRHQLAHRRLVVVVADDAAGDAGRARADAGLVEHHDPGAVARRPSFRAP